jgi:hypothetical protein
MQKVLLLLLIFIAPSFVNAQKSFLMLQKKNNNKSVVYEIGDQISFYTETHHHKIVDEVVSFEDSIIVFDGYKINVRDITALHIDEKTRWWLRFRPAQLLLLAGAGYFILDTVNNGEVSSETLAISGVAIGAGLLTKLLIGNRIKIKGRTRLRIVHL